MEWLIKDRGKGKTTGLIYTSEATGYPIVVPNRNMAKHIKTKARDIGCDIPDPICMHELMERGRRKPEHVLIDEACSIIEAALNSYLGTDVICATMTDKKRELSKRNEYDVGDQMKGYIKINMPSTCLDCQFCRELNEGIESCCEISNEPTDKTLCRMIDINYCQSKPIWCPIQSEIN